ncbi:MAG: hypothetical protein KDK65_06410 [Chlamydiia bacterium]|nr:hypothetical protein [Chlamydiia bacterium]
MLLRLLLLLLLTSCSAREIRAYTQVVTCQDLASYHVKTPDPKIDCPDFGEKLVLSWSLLPSDLCYDDLHLDIIIRFKNNEEWVHAIPVTAHNETWVFPVINDLFCRTGGIKTYHLQICSSQGILVAEHHQLWTELIPFEEGKDAVAPNLGDSKNTSGAP